MKLDQDDVTRICQRVVDHGMDTGLVAQQFEISRRRIQQLAKHYRDTGEIPQLETPGRKPYAEYPDDLEDRILELRQRLGAGAEVIGHILRARDGISIATNRVHAILQEHEHVTENTTKQGRQRPWVRFEREYAGVTVHMDWYINDHGQRVLAVEDDASRRVFEMIEVDSANRLEKIPVDRRLARVFNHVPEEYDDPHFDLVDYLDEDVVILFDTGELRSEAQRVLALVILSNLWTALRRRTMRNDAAEHPLVNLYVEEAANIAVSDLLKQLLAQSRGFDCSVTLSMQFPAQLRSADESAYDEVLNNVSTFVTGNVPVDRRLAERLATDDMSADAVGNRLRALRRGEWLVSLPAEFDDPEPRPFLVGSLAPPPGDPDGPRPLSESEERQFEAAVADVQSRTLSLAGLELGAPSASRVDMEGIDPTEVRMDSALPHTKRMPPSVTYESAPHALHCTLCDNRYDPSPDGMRNAIECWSSLDAVDPDDIPICEVNLKLTPKERKRCEYSYAKLLFLQAVYNAQQLRYDPLEYDLLHDSMKRLHEYVGIESDAVEDLIDEGLLRHDTDHPHRMYTVTPEGRAVIGESHRRGVDFGHGEGDLEESTAHVFAVEVGRRYLEAEYAEDEASRVEEVIPYFEIDENQRLDVAGVDAEGEVLVAVEAERINNDIWRAAPEDYDKIADCGVEEAIWIVLSNSEAHELLSALNDPTDGVPRVKKTYAETTPSDQFRIDTPGLTAIYTARHVRDHLLGD